MNFLFWPMLTFISLAVISVVVISVAQTLKDYDDKFGKEGEEI